MTSVTTGSETLFFHRKEEIAEHLYEKICSNNKRKIGSEWEFIFLTPSGDPISRSNGYKALEEFEKVFSFQGYKASRVFEQKENGEEIPIAVKIEGFGDIYTEAGFQFEFACTVCNSFEELYEKNETAFAVMREVAFRLNHRLVFRGFIEGYANKAEGADRSRAELWTAYYERRFGKNSIFLKEYQNATASFQITLDSGADKFHEFFKALLLIEPIFSLYYANSARSFIATNSYNRFIPSQTTPIVEAWEAHNTKDIVNLITEKLLWLDVPFLPDQNHPDKYKAELFINDRPPTVRDIMLQGRLSEKNLNNVAGFLYMRPALKNFPAALLELRGIDTQPFPEIIGEIAERVIRLIYNDSCRQSLLNDYSFLSQFDIMELHRASAHTNRKNALKIEIANHPISAYIIDVLSRSTPHWSADSIQTTKQLFSAA